MNNPMMKSFHQILFWSLFISLLLSGCAVNRTKSPTDLTTLNQDPRAYLNPDNADRPVITEAQQEALAAHYRVQFFKPWHSRAPLPETEYPFWAIDWLQEARPFDINLQPVSGLRKRQLIELADRPRYPSMSRPAITIRKSILRALPTYSPMFSDPQRAGQGFPFDMLQHSSIAFNTPVLISHSSTDGAWYFAETTAVSGWIPAKDIAWVDTAQISQVEELPMISVIHDHSLLHDNKQGHYLARVDTGALLPLQTMADNGFSALVATGDKNQQAVLIGTQLSITDATHFPLTATRRNMAELAAPLMGQPYDWGGRYGFRDCSATTRDLLAPFGIWLPRNSSRQAEIGSVTDLQALSVADREQRILDEGITFFSLLTMPGHIMLYIGEQQGQALVLHTTWGLATKTLFSQEQRWIIGATVITGLQPGQEQREPFTRIKNLRSSVEKLTFPAGDKNSEK